MQLLAKAIALTAVEFIEKFDKAGKPYFNHCYTVMNKLVTEDEELLCIAILHDILEDAEITINDLIEYGFTERIIEAVTLLTHDKNLTYVQYIKRLAVNEDARKVKLADLQHNSDITRLKGIAEKDIARIRQYHEAYTYLKNL